MSDLEVHIVDEHKGGVDPCFSCAGGFESSCSPGLQCWKISPLAIDEEISIGAMKMSLRG